MRYCAFNLTFQSELPLPEFMQAASRADAAPDVRIRFGRAEDEGIPSDTPDGPYCWGDRDRLWLKIPQIARFFVTDGNSILIDPDRGTDHDSIRVFLLGSVMGALLFQRGYLVMHGNAIRIGDRCLICVGQSGTGKSVMAARFLQRGYQILADDVTPITPNHHVLPGYPRIKLWRDAATKLGLDTSRMRHVFTNIQKFEYPIEGSFGEEPLPVRWIYILGSAEIQRMSLEPIRGMARFLPLYNNTYRTEFLDMMSLRPEIMKLCGKLAGRIRLIRVTRPNVGFDVDALINRIVEDIENHP